MFIRSERLLVEQISYNLLFRWFVGLAIEDPVWNHSVFSKNRDRLITFDAVTELFNTTVEMAASKGLLCAEPASAQMHRTMFRLGQNHRSDPPGDGARLGQSGSVASIDDGGIQPDAATFIGRIASGADVSGVTIREFLNVKTPQVRGFV